MQEFPACTPLCLGRFARPCGIIRVRHVFLRHGAQIHDRVGDAVCASESYEDPAPAPRVFPVVQGDVPAAVAHQGAGVERRDELERDELGAAARAVKRFADAGRAHAVCDVDESREFLQLAK